MKMRKKVFYIGVLLLSVLLVVLTKCEKDPAFGVYDVADGKWVNPDLWMPAAVTDIDGNVYDAVQIGSQVWMAQNLRTTHYADGTLISDVSGARLYTGNLPKAYGYLYNWTSVVRDESAVSDAGLQGICPDGWHVPTQGEWKQLIDYVGSQEQYTCVGNPEAIAKALADTGGWQPCSAEFTPGWRPEVNNATGFSALPAGLYTEGSTAYRGQHTSAVFWTASKSESDKPYYYHISGDLASVGSGTMEKANGFSVRCIRGDSSSAGEDPEVATLPTVVTSPVSNIFSNSATCGGDVTSDGGADVTARGVCWSTSPAPTIGDAHTANGTGLGSYTSSLTGLSAATIYYVRAYATNSVGTAYGNEQSFITAAPNGSSCVGASTVTDIDGNSYNTVQLGAQCWMKENMRAKMFPDGTPIEQGTTNSIFTPYWYYANDDSTLTQDYGLLYNQRAAMRTSPYSNANPSGVQGICPDGWHIPSDAEWTQLTDYVGSQPEYLCYTGSTPNTSNIARSLAATTGWSPDWRVCSVGYNLNSNNGTDFTALPAGFSDGDICASIGAFAYFYTSTRCGDDGTWFRFLRNTESTVGSIGFIKSAACSVRCLRD